MLKFVFLNLANNREFWLNFQTIRSYHKDVPSKESFTLLLLFFYKFVLQNDFKILIQQQQQRSKCFFSQEKHHFFMNNYCTYFVSYEEKTFCQKKI